MNAFEVHGLLHKACEALDDEGDHAIAAYVGLALSSTNTASAPTMPRTRPMERMPRTCPSPGPKAAVPGPEPSNAANCLP